MSGKVGAVCGRGRSQRWLGIDRQPAAEFVAGARRLECARAVEPEVRERLRSTVRDVR